MDYKQILKVASNNLEDVKKVPQPPALLKDLGPPKKEEKSTKGIKSRGVQEFLNKLNKTEQVKKVQKPASITNALTDDYDVNNLFKKKERVALLPDKGIKDMMEISNMSKQRPKDRNESRFTSNNQKEKLQRVDQNNYKKTDSSRDNITKQSSGMKRPSLSSSDHPQAKKSKLDISSKSSKDFKIPRKNIASRPPMDFKDLLKLAEMNQKEQPSVETVRQIMSVELDLKTSAKKKTEEARERPPLKSSTDSRSRPPVSQTSNFKHTSNISNNKSNQLRPASNGFSNSSKMNNGLTVQQKKSIPSQNGAFNKPTNASVPNKNTTAVVRPTNGANKTIQRRPDSQMLNSASKQPTTKVKSNFKPTNGNAATLNGVEKSINKQQSLEFLRRSLNGASPSMRRDLMNLILKHETQSNKTVNKEPQKRPIPNRSGPPVSTARPSTSIAKRPLQNKPLNGFEEAMRHLVPKSATKPKVRNEDDHYGDDDDYDDDDDSFIDDSFIDDTEEYNQNYSEHIRSVFNYDKRKYKDEKDDDLSCMESKFKDIEKEEKRSLRIGKKEDLEELRKEEEEKRNRKIGRR